METYNINYIDKMNLLLGACITVLLGFILFHFSLSQYPFLPPLHTQSEIPDTVSSEPSVQTAPKKKIEYGFNVDVTPDSYEKVNIIRYKKNIDELYTEGIRDIRISMKFWHIAPSGTAGEIYWDETQLSVYDEMLGYATDKGFRVFLVTSVPHYAQAYSEEQYAEVTRLYYTRISQRYGDKVYIWQIFNEPDVHHYRDYHVMGDFTAAYVRELAPIVKIASEAIRAGDEDAIVTVNIGHWVGWERDFRTVAPRFYDYMYEYVDVVTLDMYADDSAADIARLDDYVDFYAERYDKPVLVGEIGVSTGERFSEEDQERYLTQALQSLESGRVKPRYVYIFTYQDTTNSQDAVQNGFGLLRLDGTKKDGYERVMEMVFE